MEANYLLLEQNPLQKGIDVQDCKQEVISS